MSCHFVAKAVQSPDTPVVLKIGCNKSLILNEAAVLRHFKGSGSVRILALEADFNALLLEQAIPGHSLKIFYPHKIDMVMSAYANVIHKIHRYPVHEQAFPSVAKWLDSLDKINSSAIDDQILQLAKGKRNALLATMQAPRLLHGDLHLDNILENAGEWICIDPQGVLGEPEFEVAAFDIFAPFEIDTASTHLFSERMCTLAKITNLNPDRLKDWFFVRLVLSAAWSIEDKGNPETALKLASLLKPLL